MKKKQIIENFIEFLQENNVTLQKLEYSNHPSNDYYRQINWKEIDSMIEEFIKR